MKRLFKWMLRLILLVIALLVLLILFKDSILRAATERRIRAKTGMDVKIGKFSSSLLSPVVNIEHLKLYNTAEFGGGPFLEVAEIHAELDPFALLRRKLRVTLMRFNLAELDVVKNEAGQTNVMKLLAKGPKQASGAGGGLDLFRGFKFEGIDMLNFSLANARFIDLKDSRNNHESHIGMQNQVFRNVKSGGDLYGVLLLIWLRSGGNFGIAPVDLAKDYLNQKMNKTAADVRRAIEETAAPLKK